MTSKSPRIYTYKITFEEVPYYYYGSKKEKYYNQEYWGSPITNKWCWEFYTPKKQILEIFDYTDEGYRECRTVEDRLIKPVLNDPWCLNEHCGGKISLEINRKTGKIMGNIYGNKNKELKKGIFSYDTEKIKENGKKGGIQTKLNKSGIFSLTKEQRQENSRKSLEKHKNNKTGIYSLSLEERIKNSKKGDIKNKENGTGIYSIPKEKLQECAKKTNSQKWKCTETGFITSPGSLSRYQKARGIDVSKRIRLS